jgi:hypothetical protein
VPDPISRASSEAGPAILSSKQPAHRHALRIACHFGQGGGAKRPFEGGKSVGISVVSKPGDIAQRKESTGTGKATNLFLVYCGRQP